MSFPAEEAFERDPEVTYARWKVWGALKPPFLSFSVAMAVKADVVQHRSRVSKASVIDALAWLERKGYVVVHSRDRRGTPNMTLEYALPEAHTRTEAAS